eukprot:2110517-Pyramimonas_sp.AAC.1
MCIRDSIPSQDTRPPRFTTCRTVLTAPPSDYVTFRFVDLYICTVVGPKSNASYTCKRLP